MRCVKLCFAGAVLFAFLFVSDVSSEVVGESDNSDYIVGDSIVLALKLISEVTGPPNSIQGNKTRYECDGDCVNERICKYDPEARKKFCECIDDSMAYSRSQRHCVTTCEECSDCGGLGDRRCVFDPENVKKICECADENKKYAISQGRCSVSCGKEPDQCHNEGTCAFKNYDGEEFCSCLDGFSGDFCDVDECLNQCGEKRSDIQCEFDYDSSTPVCTCTEPKHGFDYDSKTCEECDCGGPLHRCEYRGGKKICKCLPTAYEKDGKCEDCNCGEQSTGCRLGPSGEKICSCEWKHANNNGMCEQCGCGDYSGCSFRNGKKVCECQRGNSKNNENICSPCDCGPGEKCWFDKDNKKHCDCNPGYTEYNGKCIECECGVGGDCHYDIIKICSCHRGYIEYDRKCEKCDCGAHGNCSLFDWHKYCSCDEGYFQTKGGNDTCEVCDCGERGSCSFEKGNKLCDCGAGYADLKGSCQECNCGNNSENCRFNSTGAKVCKCKEGYGQLLGECKSCRDCGKDERVIECTFDEDGERHCDCPIYQGNYKGQCKDCTCGPFGLFCDFTGNTTQCDCRRGFEDKAGYCTDIDECSVLEKPCNSSLTSCINTPGSYRCDCKRGYKPVEDNSRFEFPEGTECVSDKRTLMIAGIVIGVLLMVAGAGISVYVYIKRKRGLAAAARKNTNEVGMSHKF